MTDRAHAHLPMAPSRSIGALIALVFVVLLAAAPAAQAATVGIDQYHGTVYYVAGTGEANNVTVSLGSGSYAISDPAASITAQGGCSLADSHHASCATTGVKWIYVSTADLGDVITLQAPTPAWVDCGQGSDSVTSATAMNEYLWSANCELVNAPPPPTPTPTSPPPLPASSPLVIQNPVATMTRAGSVPIPLSCASSAVAGCTGTIILELPPRRAHRSGVTTSRRGAPNILGRKEISLARGKKKPVTVSMTSRGRGLVKRHRRLRVTAVIKLKQGGTVTTSTQALTIKAPAR